MRRIAALVLAAMLLSAGSAVGLSQADTPAAPAASEAASLDKLVSALEKNAALWADGKAVDESAEADLDKMTYTEAMVPDLQKALSGTRKGAEDLYVVNRLLEPLLRADRKVAEALLPTVRSLESRLVRYRNLPQLSRAALAGLKHPKAGESKLSASDLLRQINTIDARQQAKIAVDLEVERPNSQARALEIKIFHLLVKCGDGANDKQAMKMLNEAQSKGRSIVAEYLKDLAAQAGDLNADRAGFWWPDLSKTGEELKYVKAVYSNWGKLDILPDENSTLAGEELFPGILYLTAANALAPKAGKELAELPSSRDVEAYGALVAAAQILPADRPFDKQVQAASKLREVIHKYGGTEAAKKAQELLDSADGKLSQARQQFQQIKKLNDEKKPIPATMLKANATAMLEIGQSFPGTRAAAEAAKHIRTLEAYARKR